MKAVRTLKSQAGFSLIELMIVVAIIGILATVAIPNFQRFQAKARQSGGKSLLAGYYSAQKAAYSEFTYYPGNFLGAGFKPEGQLVYRLVANDNAVTGTAVMNPIDQGTVASGCVTTGTAPSAANCGAGYLNPGAVWTEMASAAAPVACTAAAAGAVGAQGTFLACVSANIGGTVADTWSIDQIKTVAMTSNGLP